jgi:hypothetical protein
MDVATPQDLADELGGTAALDNLTSESFTARHVLELTLADILDSLRNRTPPVVEGDISDTAQLKRPLVEGAISRLYRNNITTGDDVNAAKQKLYQRAYDNTLASLRPVVAGLAVAASGFSIPMHRR